MLRTKSLSVTMQLFWDSEMVPHKKALAEGRYIFPEIQNIYDGLNEQIIARYNQEASIYPEDVPLRGTMVSGSGVVAMSSQVVAGWFPSIHICVPVWSQIFFHEQFLDSQNFRLAFGAAFVIGLLHEKIHLGFGLVPQENRMQVSHMLDSERITWGHTCDVIRLYKKRGIKILDSLNSCELKWESCGRNNNSRCWKDHIRVMHCGK